MSMVSHMHQTKFFFWNLLDVVEQKNRVSPVNLLNIRNSKKKSNNWGHWTFFEHSSRYVFNYYKNPQGKGRNWVSGKLHGNVWQVFPVYDLWTFYLLEVLDRWRIPILIFCHNQLISAPSTMKWNHCQCLHRKSGIPRILVSLCIDQPTYERDLKQYRRFPCQWCSDHVRSC